MDKITERRRARRRLTEAELIVFSRGIPQAARLLDVSERGVRLETTEYLPVQIPLVVVLSAAAQSLTLTARVRFQRAGSGTGLEFLRLTRRDRGRLAEFIETCSLR
jgi:hypothetical protein